MRQIRRLGIVNRGEPAIRALTAVSELNAAGGEPQITTVAFYAESDAHAWFVHEADEAVRLCPVTAVAPAARTDRTGAPSAGQVGAGPAGRVGAIPAGPAGAGPAGQPAESGPRFDPVALLDALRAANVDAVWPGWGTVAGHAAFARLCEESGMLHIGPDSAAIRLLEDPAAVARLVELAGVPVAPAGAGEAPPGTTGPGSAVSGGAAPDTAGPEPGRARPEPGRTGPEPGRTGPEPSRTGPEPGRTGPEPGRTGPEPSGTGPEPEALRDGPERGGPEQNRPELGRPERSETGRDGPARGGDGADPGGVRRVEVQIAADAYGAVWALGVRDRSLRRGSRTVLEESTCTALTSGVERAIRQAAVRIAAAAGYRAVGTVEFLFHQGTGRFEFLRLEPNPRIEQPVTELTTGIDLARLQLHLARGGQLSGEPPATSGHALAVWLRAEDPADGFAPTPGRLAVLNLPTGVGIRVDTGVREGDRLDGRAGSPVARITAWGHDRDEALSRLRRAVGQTTAVVAGGTTDRSMLLDLLHRPEVADGRYDDRWLDLLIARGDHLPAPDPVAVLVAAVAAYDRDHADQRAAFHAQAARGCPRLPAVAGHACRLRYHGVGYRLRVFRTGSRSYRVHSDRALADVVVDRLDAYRQRVTVGGRRHRVVTVAVGGTLRVEVDGVAHTIGRDDGEPLLAGWPALVVSVLVAPGDRVSTGDPLMVLESMKMESTVTAPYGGQVTAIEVAPNTEIEAEAPLLRLRPDTPPGDEHPPTADRAPSREQVPAGDQTPTAARAPSGEQVPTGDQAPAAERAPSGEQVPTGDQAPAAERAPSREQAATGDQAPAEEPVLDGKQAPGRQGVHGAECVPGGQTARPVRFAGLTAGRPDRSTCERVYDALLRYLLGYDQDAQAVRRMAVRQRRLGERLPAADPGLLACEDALLDLFADAGSLYRPRTGAEGWTPDGAEPGGDSPQEYLLHYLQWLDADRAGLPDDYRRRLATALSRYGVTGLDRTPELEEAVVWLFRSFRRVGELVPVVTEILQRRLRNRDVLAGLDDARLRARLDRLITATEGRYQVVADLAHDVRYRYLDEPLLSGLVAEEYTRMAAYLDALRSDPDGPDRAAHIDRLVASPQPLRGLLLARWARSGTVWHTPASRASADAERRVLLEVQTRRFYRTRDLRDLRIREYDGWQLCTADFDLDGRKLHLVVAYANLSDLPKLSAAVAGHLAEVAPDRSTVVDLTARGHGEPGDVSALAAEVGDLLTCCDFGRPLHRLDITVTSAVGQCAEHVRTRHLTFRPGPDGGFIEDRLFRNLHPMLAKRLELWRLSTFALERLRSPEDVYLFHGVAHDNPADHRLFALAEVRDLTPVRDADGEVSYPRLELMALSALAAIRAALAGFPPRERPVTNRIVLYVRPPWTVPREVWSTLARPLASMATGAGLERMLLRVRMPLPDGGGLRDSVLHVDGLGGGGVTVREQSPGQSPVRPVTPYRQKVLRARRFGAPYPYELLRMLTPPPGAVSRFPSGRFAEYDLDGDNRLVPVERPPGGNSANVVVGLISNNTVKVPEGMTRVIVLGDPTRGLGNVAEPECRRIIAALDLAERMRLPVEWFALSSGARIAMDSGTENMDWIAAVLRRLIEFTQAGNEINVVVTGINVGAQPYWNAEATMIMHTRGILVMTPESAMVLTGKQALGFSGGVSADDNFGIGGFDRIMGPNGQSQHWAATIAGACEILLRHYDHTYVVPGERHPRRAVTGDPVDRDVCTAPHAPVPGSDLRVVGDIFSAEHNPDRKKPFDIRSVLRAVADADCEPLERWHAWRDAENAVVWDAHIGGYPVCLLGLESHTRPRHGFVPAGGPPAWSSGTLFPQSSRKVARAVNAASGNRPVVMLANLSGFDGSPESMRAWQLEYGAEIGRAVTNFRGPIVFVVVSRYHGGAFVVFSKTLNEGVEVAAVEGSYASVIGGAPAAATVFAREVAARTERDRRVVRLRERLGAVHDESAAALRAELAATTAAVRAEHLGAVAREFDGVHTVQRAMRVGSVDRIITAPQLRPYIVDAIERGLARADGTDGPAS